MYSFEKSQQSFFAVSKYNSDLVTSLGFWLLNRGSRLRLIGWNIDLSQDLMRSFMNDSYLSWPSFSIVRTVCMTGTSAMFLLSRTSKSTLSSWKGLPISSITQTRAVAPFLKAVCISFVCLWCCFSFCACDRVFIMLKLCNDPCYFRTCNRPP